MTAEATDQTPAGVSKKAIPETPEIGASEMYAILEEFARTGITYDELSSPPDK